MDTFLRYEDSATPGKPGPVVSDKNRLPTRTTTVNSVWRDDGVLTVSRTLWEMAAGLATPADGFLGDAVVGAGNVQGAGWWGLVQDAAGLPAASSVLAKQVVKMPLQSQYGMSISQRVDGEIVKVELIEVDEKGVPVLSEGDESALVSAVSVPVASIVVASNVATINFSADIDLKYDESFVISGGGDSRFWCLLRVSDVVGPRSVTCPLTATNGTYVMTGAIAQRVNLAQGSPNVHGMVFYGTSSTNGTQLIRSAGGAPFHTAQTTIATSATDATSPAAKNFSYNYKPRVLITQDVISRFARLTVNTPDSVGSTASSPFKSDQQTVSPDATYAVRLTVASLPNHSRVIEIDTATKTGASTATVLCKTTHGVPAGATAIYARAYGAANQTNWANLTTEAAVTYVDAMTLTIPWGAAVNDTLKGGVLVIVGGGAAAIPATTGANNNSIRGVCWCGGKLYVATNGAVSGLAVGDLVRPMGVNNPAGSAPMPPARFRVAAINPNICGTATAGGTVTNGSATVTLANTSFVPFNAIVAGTNIPASDYVTGVNAGVSITLNAAGTPGSGATQITIQGLCLEPVGFTHADEQPLTAFNGALIKETELRIHSVRGRDFEIAISELAGGIQTGDNLNSVGVHFPATQTLAATGPAAHGASISGNPVRMAARALSALYTALTTGQVADLITDLAGRLVVQLGGLPQLQGWARVTVTTTTETTLQAAAASTRYGFQLLAIANRDNVAHTVDIRETTGGTVRMSPIVQAGQTLLVPIPDVAWQAAANTNWTVQLREAATTAVEVFGKHTNVNF